MNVASYSPEKPAPYQQGRDILGKDELELHKYSMLLQLSTYASMVYDKTDDLTERKLVVANQKKPILARKRKHII